MKSINLVPKIPRAQRLFLPVVLSAGVLFTGISAAILLYYNDVEAGLAARQTEANRMDATVQLLRQERIIDPQTTDYNQFKADVEQLRASGRDWLAVLTLLTGRLPENARLISIEGSGSPAIAGSAAAPSASGTTNAAASPQGGETVKLSGEFAELSDPAQYIVRLQNSPLIAAVVIKSVKRVVQDVPQPSPVQTPPSAGPTAPDASQSAATSTENYIRSLQSGVKPPETKGDELLNELNWLMTRQMAQQQFGIALPETPAAGSVGSAIDSAASGSAITEEDIQQARNRLEQFKNQKPAEPASPAAPSADPSLQPVQPETKLPPVIKYAVSIEVTLKPPAKENQGK